MNKFEVNMEIPSGEELEEINELVDNFIKQLVNKRITFGINVIESTIAVFLAGITEVDRIAVGEALVERAKRALGFFQADKKVKEGNVNETRH